MTASLSESFVIFPVKSVRLTVPIKIGKKSSEVLKNWIKKHNSDNPSQKIVINEGENFAKLFKIYKII